MINPRDITQRLFGCVGFSFILHTALGALILFLPTQIVRKPIEMTEAILIDESQLGPALGDPSSSTENLGSGNTISNSPSEPTVPASSTSAATIPAPQPEPVAPAPQPVQEKPITQKSESVPAPVPAPVVKAEPKPEAVVEKPVREKPKTAKPKIKAAAVKTPKPAPIKAQPALDPENIHSDPDMDLYEQQAKNAEALEEKIEPVRKAEDDHVLTEQQAADNMFGAKDAAEETKPEPAPVAAAVEPTESSSATLAPTGSSEQTAALGEQSGSSVPTGIRNADTLAAAPGNRAPIYPERDRLMKNEGSVKILAYVNGDGSIANVKLQQASKSKSLDEAALSAFRKWRFQPGQATWTVKEFVFRLNGEVEELPARLRR